jgi:hypothetical protein
MRTTQSPENYVCGFATAREPPIPPLLLLLNYSAIAFSSGCIEGATI